MTDTTRPHPRVSKQEVQGRRLPLPIGTLYVSSTFKPRESVPLLVHFHGAPWLIEYFVSHELPNVALVTVQLGAGSRVYADTFSDATPFHTLLSLAREELSRATGRDITWSSVTLSSFSAGYGAIWSILQQREHYARVDTILLADSLHTDYQPVAKADELRAGDLPLQTDALDIFARFAADAAGRRKRMWITHSEVYPGTYAGTTETADYLLSRLGISRTPVLRKAPIGMQQLSSASKGHFHLTGYAGNSAQDHLDHLHAFGDWFRRSKVSK